MSFKDYSTTPSGNTTLGDGTYIGPNMLRNKVRPALQQFAADGRELYDFVVAQNGGEDLPSFVQSGAGAVATDAQIKMRQLFSPEDFGALGNGVANDSPAFILCIAAAAGRQIDCAPGKTYLINAQLLITGSLRLNLNGSTLKPNGNTACITSGVATAAVSAVAVSSGYTKNSRQVVVGSAVGLAVGQITEFKTNDATHDSVSGEKTYPPAYNEIHEISGTTITLKYPMPVTFLGTVTMNAYAASAFKDELHVVNGKIDGSESTYTAATGNGIRACGFKRVYIDLDFVNFNRNTSNLYIVQCFRNLEVEGRLRTRGMITTRAAFDIQDTRRVILPIVQVEGSGFAVSVTRADYFQGGLLNLRGQSANEVVMETALGRVAAAGDPLGSSTRGFKGTAIGHYQIATVMGEGYESLIRITSCFSGSIDNIYSYNCGRSADSVVVSIGNDSLDGTNMRGLTFGTVTCVNTTGSALGIQNSPPDPQVVIGTLVVKNVSKHAIYSLRPLTIGQALIEQWATVTSVPAIQAREGGIFGPMAFEHTDVSKVPFDGTLTTGKEYSFETVKMNTTAGFFSTASRYNLDVRGSATILSGTTSIVVSHFMKFSPGADDISITPTNNPTNDPGNLYVSAAGASSFTVSCRTDPGTSGATFAWHVNNPDVLTV